jgi:Zn-finger protein
MILMVDGTHHDEGHQKQKLREKNNRYEGISLVKNGSCAFYPCGDTLQNCRASN